MLRKTIGKRVASGLVTAAMLASASVAALPGLGLTASAAGELLGQTNFDKGIGLPWHTCVSQPAHLTFSISGGTYNVTIDNPGGATRGGDSRWDCQLRHRKLQLFSGVSYTTKCEITSDQDGEIIMKIGDLGGDVELWHGGYGDNIGTITGRDTKSMGSCWDPVPVKAGTTLKVDCTWTCTQDMEVAEWAFHFGGQGQYQEKGDCFPEGTTLKFDNMSLYNNTNDKGVWVEQEPAPEYSVHGNQVGYYTNLNKKATYHSDSSFSAKEISIVDAAAKKVVYTGKTTAGKSDKDSGYYTGTFDFSDFKTPGTYYFATSGTTQDSYEFTISDSLYDGVLTNALNYYYQNRSGLKIEETYITSAGANASKSVLAHQAGHSTDSAAIQSKWVKAYKSDASDVETSNGTVDGVGGWYDAGDHGKYVVNGGISVWTLQNLYEWSINENNHTDAKKFADKSGTVVIPEAGNGNPDLLDEARYELEWFFQMMVGSGYSMDYDLDYGKDTKTYTGMVYHKLHDHKWTGLAVKCWDYATEWKTVRIVKPPSTAATLNVAACAAQAARLWADIDSSFADTCLANAKATYAAAKANPELYAPLDQAIGGGAYGDDNVKDDFYWAATELYLTTGDKAYLTDLEGYADAYKVVTNLSGGENSSSFTSFNWGNTAGLGTLSMYLNEDKVSGKFADIKDTLATAGDAYIAEESSQGFGIPYRGTTFEDAINIGEGVKVTGYEWGSNSMVINNAMVMAYAYSATGDAKYLNGVSEAMDYIYGRNAMDISYVTGYGTYHCTNPHHRWWSHELDSDFPYAPSGVLSGGPNSGMQDPYIAGAGYIRGEVPAQLCYVDSIEAWSVNEVTINWNAPFAWVSSFMEDEANESGSIVEPEVKWGDVNCDKLVNIDDVILLNRYVSEDKTISVTAQGVKNADVINDGTPTSEDSILIMKYLARLVEYSELGKKPA